MANLNLSQFTEKLFVADADHTFIWDTAASISKRVSRNSWLNSGTLTSDAPVTISQTWGAVGQTFKAFVVNAAGSSGTNGASGSLLLDLQVGTVSQFSVRKDGFVQVAGGMASPGGIYTTSATPNLSFGWLNGGTFGLSATAILGWTASDARGAPDTILLRDGEQDHLAMRRSTNGQKFSVYGTYPGAAWERFTITAPTSGNVLLGTYKGTGGVARGLEFQTDGVTRMSIAATGEISTGNNRIGITPGGLINNGGALGLYFGYSASQPGFTIASAQIIMTAPIFKFNVLDNTGPALKRSSTTLQTRLADDSAFAPIQGKLTTDTAFTATTVTPTGFITLYDSTGTAYKVPCVPA